MYLLRFGYVIMGIIGGSWSGIMWGCMCVFFISFLLRRKVN